MTPAPSRRTENIRSAESLQVLHKTGWKKAAMLTRVCRPLLPYSSQRLTRLFPEIHEDQTDQRHQQQEQHNQCRAKPDFEKAEAEQIAVRVQRLRCGARSALCRGVN